MAMMTLYARQQKRHRYVEWTSWKIDGETVETVADFTFLGSKITADGDYSHEIKRCLLLGRKVMTNLDSILKSRDITLSTKVHQVKAMLFPVVMYGCESLSGKEPACQCRRQRRRRLDLWVRKVPWGRAWQATPVFLSGESHEQGSLEGYSPWGYKSKTRLCN